MEKGSTYQDPHSRPTDPHPLDQGREGVQDFARVLGAPYVVGAQMHHHHVWVRLRQPAWQLFVGDNTRGQEAAMALVGAVVGEAASLGRKRPDEFRIGDFVGLELLPQQGTPASL
jgi:hypothetical protein